MESELGLLNDQRLEVIGELVQGIMPIKLFGWGSRFIDIVGEKRAKQLLLLWRRAKVWCWINLWTMGSLPIISFVSFILYSIGHDLEASTVFAAISVFKIIQRPVDIIALVVADSVSIFVSFKRISAYLKQVEIQPLEERVHMDSSDGSNVVGFKDATLSWETSPRSGRFVLKNLDVNFPKGKLTIVGGPTGCGKSSMLSALVGEMQLTSGRIFVPTTALTDESAHLGSFSRLSLTEIAYVAQEPWLCNATIRDNILFGEPYDSSRYAKVLYACALVPDLLVLPAGDMSEIGERGITLSGGQKQRVALARAVYSSSIVLLIDDCLSAVDSHTAKHILHKCLLNSDDLMRNRTRILITHHMSMCLPYCDFVVLLNDGSINFQGLPHDLEDGTADVYNTDSDLESSETNSPHGMPLLPSEVSTALSKTPAATENTPETAPFSETASPTDGKLIDDEVRIHGMVKKNAWKTYFAPCGGWYFALTCIVSLLGAQVLAIYRDYYLASRLDIMDSSPSCILVIYLLIGFVAALISSGTFLFMYLRSLRASKLFHELLLKSIVYAIPRFLETTPIGRIMTRFSKDMQIIDENIIEILYYFLRAIITVGLTLLVISSATPLFIVAGTISMTIYVRVSWRYIVGARETKRLEATSNAPMLSLFSEIVPGGKTIRSFGMQQAYMVEMERRFMEYLSADMMMRVYRRWIGIRLGIVSTTITFFTAILILMDIDHFSSGLAGFTLIYAVQLLSESASAIRKYSSLELSINSVERAHQYMTIAQEALAKTSAELRQVLQSKNWPQSGNLVVKNLVAGYTADRAVLHGISFHVRHGEKIGIVGRTGAGKSTMSLALLRIVEPISGCVELDGTDISSVGLEDLRKNITTIPQDPALFNGTVRFNLDPFGDYTDMELVGVLRRTLLLGPAPTAAFYSLDDEITSHGQNLSLGQRQLVALARALVRKSRLVVMDEATASVDFETDKEMQCIIRGPEFANSTVLCIAHRLRTVIDYDRVLVLDNGRIVEFDSPAKLLNNTGSMFRQMCADSGELAHLEKAAVDNL
ncbi:hypothetical protein GGI05_001498 [Coemansia sp. RSA 2603]|nr:hypothetical protein GGI05_001498 [Coemansia sp. RSA 2603]